MKRFICEFAALPEGEPFGASVDGIPIVLIRLGEAAFALSGLCTHANASLAKGFVEGDSIECPLHEARFDIRTGRCLARPAVRNLKTYPVSVETGGVFVGFDATNEDELMHSPATVEMNSKCD